MTSERVYSIFGKFPILVVVSKELGFSVIAFRSNTDLLFFSTASRGHLPHNKQHNDEKKLG